MASLSIKIHVVKPPNRNLFGQFPNCRPNPSAVVVSQLRILFAPPTPTPLNSTVESHRRRRCVLGNGHVGIIIMIIMMMMRVLRSISLKLGIFNCGFVSTKAAITIAIRLRFSFDSTTTKKRTCSFFRRVERRRSQYEGRGLDI